MLIFKKWVTVKQTKNFAKLKTTFGVNLKNHHLSKIKIYLNWRKKAISAVLSQLKRQLN